MDGARTMTRSTHGNLVTSSAAQQLALATVAGPLVFAATWFVLGFMSPGYTLFGAHIAPYSPMTQPISGLGLGITGPYMNAAFVVCGLLIVVGVLGVFQAIPNMGSRARRTCTVALALSGVGAVMDGIFTLESMLLHFVGFLLAITPIVGFLVVGLHLRRVEGWRRFGTWLLSASPLTLTLTVLFFATLRPGSSRRRRGRRRADPACIDPGDSCLVRSPGVAGLS
jgi:hypothetical membrane protein